jgi:lysophospholipase L1-like esterase
MNIHLKKAGSLIFMVLWLFVCGEVVLRVFSMAIPIYDVEMMRYAKALKVRSPISGIFHQHRANASYELMNVEVSLNNLGHRNPELKTPKPKNERRIHFIGSSMTLGWGVTAKDTFSLVVPRLLNEDMKTKTDLSFVGINAGIGNYNTFYEVELLKRQIDLTKPDMVVIQYHVNDAQPNPEGKDNPILKYSEFVAFIYINLKSVMAVATKTLAEYYQDLYEDGSPSWERAKKSISDLKSLSDSYNIPVVAVLVPDLHDLSEDGPYPPLYALIEKAFNKNGIDMVNPLQALRVKFKDGLSKAWVYRDDPHPSAEAHRIIAEKIVGYLKAHPIW